MFGWIKSLFGKRRYSSEKVELTLPPVEESPKPHHRLSHLAAASHAVRHGFGHCAKIIGSAGA